MAPTVGFYNRIIFNANSAGTGNFLVFTAVTGYRTPATAGVADETVVSYTAETADRTQWETGQGTYDVATTTVRRTTVRENSSGTTAIIDFATAPIVRLDFHKQDIPQDFFVDVRDFGYVGDNATDDSDAIQAAIDWAFNNSRSAVRIPAGTGFKITKPIWLAKPGSYNSVAPTLDGGIFSDFSYSMALIGGEGLGNNNQFDVTCYPVRAGGGGFFDYPAFIIGPGQGMRVAGISVNGTGSLFTTTHDPNSIGFAISGGPAGASRTLIERCWVTNSRYGFVTGWNDDSLADSNTFFKCCVGGGVHIGFYIRKSQNYINELISCSSHATTGLRSDVGKAVQVFGGNFSYVGAISVDFDISGTTGLSLVAGFYARFSTVITFDPGDLFGFAENGFTDGGPSTPIYNAFAIETANFGIIPLDFVSYDSGTNTVTLDLQEDWITTYFGFNPPVDMKNDLDLEADLAACTILLATQKITVFHGTGIHAYGTHIENPNSVTCLVDCDSGFQGDKGCTLENLYFNYAPSSDMSVSQRKIQSVWPFIGAMTGDVRITDGMFNGSSSGELPLIIAARTHNVYMDRVSLNNYNLYPTSTGQTLNNQVTQITNRGGFGSFDVIPFYATDDDARGWSSQSGIGIGWAHSNRGQYPSFGYLPAPGVIPEITHDHYDLVTAAAPLVTDKGTYPVICGQTLYQVIDHRAAGGTGSEVFVRSDHDQFSWGQDFTVNWTYKGQSPFLYVEDTGFFFSGLKIGLDNGGGVEWYYVTGVYTQDNGSTPRAGYIACLSFAHSGNQTPGGLTGTKTTTYTGSTVYQEVYDFSSIGGATTTTTGGRELLTVATTWHVATTGSDVTGDGSMGLPWETLQFALSYIADTYELGDEIHTIQLADGTYMGSAVEKEFIGGGFLQILGNSGNVASVVLDGALNSHYHAAFAFQTPQDTIVALADMTLISDQYVLRIINRCQFRMGYINFGGKLVLGASSGSVYKINCIPSSAGSIITDRTDEVTISGNCLGYIGVSGATEITLGENGGTTIMSGTPAFSVATFFAENYANIDSYPTTFSGAATGKRYDLADNAHLRTYNNGTLTYIPGNAEGTIASGASVNYHS